MTQTNNFILLRALIDTYFLGVFMDSVHVLSAHFRQITNEVFYIACRALPRSDDIEQAAMDTCCRSETRSGRQAEVSR